MVNHRIGKHKSYNSYVKIPWQLPLWHFHGWASLWPSPSLASRPWWRSFRFRFCPLLSTLFYMLSSVLCCHFSVFSLLFYVLHPLNFVLDPLPTRLCSMPCPISDRSRGAVPLGAGTIKAQLDCMIRGQQVQDFSGTTLYWTMTPDRVGMRVL